MDPEVREILKDIDKQLDELFKRVRKLEKTELDLNNAIPKGGDKE